MTFTTDVVTETLHKIVEAKGEDYVYPRANRSVSNNCRYAEEDGTPSCIVGHVIAALEPEAFKAIAEAEEATGHSADVKDVIRGWREGYDWETDTYLFETPAVGYEDEIYIDALQLAQNAQDLGMTWGKARGYYDRYVAGGENFLDMLTEIKETAEARAEVGI